MEDSWSWHNCSPDLARYFLPLVHFSAVLCEFVLACEAIAFSVVLASDLRAFEFGGVLAVPGVSVADEVRPALRAEAAILDSTGEWGFGSFRILPEMGPLMRTPIDRSNLPRSLVRPAAFEMTSGIHTPVPSIDTYFKTHNAGTFLGGAYAR